MPGVTNLVTGLATATSEGDPVLAIGAEVPLDNRFKHTHQALDGVDVIPPATKCAESELTIHSLPEIFGNAVRAAESGRPGAAFLGFPKDVGLAEFPGEPSIAWGRATPMGADHPVATTKAAELIDSARQPVYCWACRHPNRRWPPACSPYRSVRPFLTAPPSREQACGPHLSISLDGSGCFAITELIAC